jgi:hypothetical protein
MTACRRRSSQILRNKKPTVRAGQEGSGIIAWLQKTSQARGLGIQTRDLPLIQPSGGFSLCAKACPCRDAGTFNWHGGSVQHSQ